MRLTDRAVALRGSLDAPDGRLRENLGAGETAGGTATRRAMIQLLLGLGLFAAPHLLKRLAPGARARLGDPGKGVIALLLVAGTVLMARGYGAWDDSPVFWGRTSALTGINNLLVVVAFYLFAASGLRTRVTRFVRHPQLTAVILWAVAHLLVNGDLASLVLFGGLLLWALVEVALINRAEPAWTPPPPAPFRREVMAVVGTAVVVAVVGWIHGWIGPWPFG